MTKEKKSKDVRTPTTLSDPRVQNMSLRDYFAAHALMAVIADPDPCDTSYTVIADNAYALADAMMEARKQ